MQTCPLLVVLYLHFPRVLLAQGESNAIDLQGHCLGKRHGPVAPVVVLYHDGEGDQCRVLGAERSKLVDAASLEVIAAPIKGGVVGVPSTDTCGKGVGLATLDSIHHGTLLMGLAAGLLTGHRAQDWVTPAASAAVLIGPELLSGLVMMTIMATATALLGDAVPGMEDVARVALA